MNPTDIDQLNEFIKKRCKKKIQDFSDNPVSAEGTPKWPTSRATYFSSDIKFDLRPNYTGQGRNAFNHIASKTPPLVLAPIEKNASTIKELPDLEDVEEENEEESFGAHSQDRRQGAKYYFNEIAKVVTNHRKQSSEFEKEYLRQRRPIKLLKPIPSEMEQKAGFSEYAEMKKNSVNPKLYKLTIKEEEEDALYSSEDLANPASIVDIKRHKTTPNLDESSGSGKSSGQNETDPRVSNPRDSVFSFEPEKRDLDEEIQDREYQMGFDGHDGEEEDEREDEEEEEEEEEQEEEDDEEEYEYKKVNESKITRESVIKIVPDPNTKAVIRLLREADSPVPNKTPENDSEIHHTKTLIPETQIINPPPMLIPSSNTLHLPRRSPFMKTPSMDQLSHHRSKSTDGHRKHFSFKKAVKNARRHQSFKRNAMMISKDSYSTIKALGDGKLKGDELKVKVSYVEKDIEWDFVINKKYTVGALINDVLYSRSTKGIFLHKNHPKAYQLRAFEDEPLHIHKLTPAYKRQELISGLKCSYFRISLDSEMIERLKKKEATYKEIEQRLAFMNLKLPEEDVEFWINI